MADTKTMTTAERQQRFRERRDAKAKLADEQTAQIDALRARFETLQVEVADIERQRDLARVALAVEELKLEATRRDYLEREARRHADLEEEIEARDPEFEAAQEAFILRWHRDRPKREAKKRREAMLRNGTPAPPRA